MPHAQLKRMVYLTAGAGGMFCGSCMHDNTLARALGQRGYDVQLVPVYTPIRTDEDDFAVDQVFFGGINVYLQQKLRLFRLIPQFLDRFLDSPWLIRRLTNRAIATDPKVLGNLTLSMLQGMEGNQRKEVARLSRWLRSHAKPDLILLSNMLIGGSIPVWRRDLNVPIVATLQGDDVFLDYLPDFYRDKATALIQKLAQQVDGFLTHTHFYADRMAARFAIERDKIHVTPLGIDTTAFESMTVPRGQSQQTVGYLARLAPEKGLHLLVDAFIQLAQSGETELRLLIGGWLAAENRAYAEEQFTKLRRANLESRFEYRGVLDRGGKLKFLQECTLFSVPAAFLEPKGLYVLEAMAAGLPVVMPDHGAFREIAAEAQTGWLFPPGDSSALAKTLKQALDNPATRVSAANRGREFVLTQRTAAKSAEQTAAVLERISGELKVES